MILSIAGVLSAHDVAVFRKPHSGVLGANENWTLILRLLDFLACLYITYVCVTSLLNTTHTCIFNSGIDHGGVDPRWKILNSRIQHVAEVGSSPIIQPSNTRIKVELSWNALSWFAHLCIIFLDCVVRIQKDQLLLVCYREIVCHRFNIVVELLQNVPCTLLWNLKD